ncbi:MAG: hypothetical protein JKY67_12920 [Pseudomonadales bacterium]|nr:hypothetical protein [Pseudomonadales bacterium]
MLKLNASTLIASAIVVVSLNGAVFAEEAKEAAPSPSMATTQAATDSDAVDEVATTETVKTEEAEVEKTIATTATTDAE